MENIQRSLEAFKKIADILEPFSNEDRERIVKSVLIILDKEELHTPPKE